MYKLLLLLILLISLCNCVPNKDKKNHKNTLSSNNDDNVCNNRIMAIRCKGKEKLLLKNKKCENKCDVDDCCSSYNFQSEMKTLKCINLLIKIKSYSKTVIDENDCNNIFKARGQHREDCNELLIPKKRTSLVDMMYGQDSEVIQVSIPQTLDEAINFCIDKWPLKHENLFRKEMKDGVNSGLDFVRLMNVIAPSYMIEQDRSKAEDASKRIINQIHNEINSIEPAYYWQWLGRRCKLEEDNIEKEEPIGIELHGKVRSACAMIDLCAAQLISVATKNLLKVEVSYLLLDQLYVIASLDINGDPRPIKQPKDIILSSIAYEGLLQMSILHPQHFVDFNSLIDKDSNDKRIIAANQFRKKCMSHDSTLLRGKCYKLYKALLTLSRINIGAINGEIDFNEELVEGGENSVSLLGSYSSIQMYYKRVLSGRDHKDDKQFISKSSSPCAILDVLFARYQQEAVKDIEKATANKEFWGKVWALTSIASSSLAGFATGPVGGSAATVTINFLMNYYSQPNLKKQQFIEEAKLSLVKGARAYLREIDPSISLKTFSPQFSDKYKSGKNCDYALNRLLTVFAELLRGPGSLSTSEQAIVQMAGMDDTIFNFSPSVELEINKKELLKGFLKDASNKKLTPIAAKITGLNEDTVEKVRQTAEKIGKSNV